MAGLLKNIDQRIKELRQVICQKNKELEDAPEGVLNICKTGNRIQFYHKEKAYRRYLKKGEQEIVAALCQKDYDQRVVQAAVKELNQLEKFKNNYPEEVYEDVYGKLNPDRQQYIQPVRLTDEMFVRNWKQTKYERKGFREDAPEFYTDRGERVRSKTEILIANALSKYHIPYHYEKPLLLKGYGMIHPDFTVLNVRLRKEMFWEHMGMLGDPEYMEEAFRRITMYEKNNIFPGEQLILTHETLKYPINPQNIEKMILRYLI